MKNSLLIFLIAIVQVSASITIHGQNLTLMAEGKTVREVFKQIENETNYRFFYNEEFRDLSKSLSFEMREYEIDEVLDMMLANSNVTYRILENDVIVITPHLSEFEDIEIQGRVTDAATGEPLPGANVVIQGTIIGTITDSEGYYQIDVLDQDAVLVFSYIGYLQREMVVGDLTTINVELQIDAIGIEEVVSIGYGVQKRINLTGAVSVAGAERLENRPVSSVGQALQGVIPNLIITFRDGDPTTPANYNIRGFESITGGSPLILVDGIPMDLNKINPDDIASVSVLKDASAAAVYGARGAFGIVLVETKRGKRGAFHVDFGMETSLSQPIFHVDPVLDSYKHAMLNRKVYMDNVGTILYTDYELEGFRRYSENPTPENEWAVNDGRLYFFGSNNFQNRVVADFAPQQKYNMKFSGATERTSYFASFGYLDKYGYFRDKENNLRYQRYNILMNGDVRVNDWLILDSKISINADKDNQPHIYGGEANLNTVVRITPSAVIQFPDLPYYLEPGDREQYEQYIGMYSDRSRLLPYFKEGGRDTYNQFDTWLTQGVNIVPFKGFRIRGDFSYQYRNNMTQQVRSKVNMVESAGSYFDLVGINITNGLSGNDYIHNRAFLNQYYVFNTFGEYTLDHNNHYLKTMVGFNQEWGQNMRVDARAQTLANPSVIDIGATTGLQTTDGSKSHVALRGAFYRFNYIFKDKYLLEFSGRYDGTSRFPKESRMDFFPSASAGWRISNENFMNETKGWLDNLMLRASYGSMGNQLLGSNYYAYIQNMGMGRRSFIMSNDQIPYVSPAGLVSSLLTWETVVSQNIGFDISILKRRLTVSADAYYRDTKNMLMKKSYPAILGADAPDANAADLRTKGWEVSLNWRDNIGSDFRYGINLALSDNSSEITKYENPTGAINDYYVGKKIGEIWGFETVGIFQTEAEIEGAADQSQIGSKWLPGDIQYADLNGDGRITRGNMTLDDPGDLRIIGNSTARYHFGINTDFHYKNWSLNLFFQGLFRDYDPPRSGHMNFYPWMTDMIENWWIEECWSEDNRDAYWPAPRPFRVDDATRNYQTQTRFLQNAAYIRFKNLTLSYTLPDDLTNRITWLSQARIFLGGMNLWEYTKIQKPLDAESVYSTDQRYYLQRVFSSGINITF